MLAFSLCLGLGLTFSLGLSLGRGLGPAPPAPRPNVLLIVADDLGTESVGVYDEGPAHSQPPTPTMDWMARNGVLFRNAFAQPVCSVSRACLYTGLLPSRTGIGSLIGHHSTMTLPAGLTTLPERLREHGVHCSLVGKWHLGLEDGAPYRLGPPAHGWHDFSGTRGNLLNHYSYSWMEQGPVSQRRRRITNYSTSHTTDEALLRVQRMPGPWFLTVAYHAPHGPLQNPPVHLHGYGLNDRPSIQYLAMIEAFDHELGRLLDAVDLSTTTVLFVGDNGMVARRAHFIENEQTHAKGTHYEMGSQVPMIAVGAGVSETGAVVDGLVQCTDLYDTVLDLMQVPGHAEDSISFLGALRGGGASLRQDVIVERFPNADEDPDRLAVRRTARGRRFKLLWHEGNQIFEFHDLLGQRQERSLHSLYPNTLLCGGDLASQADYEHCRDSLPAGEARDEFVRLWGRLKTFQLRSR